MKITKSTPITIVREIEPSLEFWVGKLGYQKTVEVPHEGKLGFVILTKDASEVMLQTRASLRADLPALAELLREGSTLLYTDVDSLEAAQQALKGAEILVPTRTTFYGAKEFYAREPGGQIVGFAEHG